MAELPPAGWYTDPSDSTRDRWWDGQRWSLENVKPKATSPQPVAAGASTSYSAAPAPATVAAVAEHVRLDQATEAAASPQTTASPQTAYSPQTTASPQTAYSPQTETSAETAVSAQPLAAASALSSTQLSGDQWVQSAQTGPRARSAPRQLAPSYNGVVEVQWRGGWPGLLSGENQTKALTRALVELNNAGLGVVAVATDRWSLVRQLGWALVAVVSLGFVVRHQNLLLVTAPISGPHEP